jgi:hypothetical protein
VLEVIRACLAGGAEEDEVNGDKEVALWSVSRLRLEPRLPLSFGGHVVIFVE